MISGCFDPHIRAIQLRKDLLPVADLIEMCFADHMDAEGRDYIHHVRQIARGLGNFFAEGTTPENSQLPFHGYLWEEDGKIIGNLTLIQVRKVVPGTYLIANVAVHPDWRGKGIARQLTERAIAHVKEHHGDRIHLQVREDNPSAIHIYEELGFRETARRTTWIRLKNKSLPELPIGEIQVVKRKSIDWPLQKEWLRRIYPWELTWNLPFSMEKIKPGFWNWMDIFINGGNIRAWSAYQGQELIGTAVWDSGPAGTDYVWLGPSPRWEEEALDALLPVIIRNVSQPQRISINYPAGRGVGAFYRAGISVEHTLIWMSIKMIIL